MDGAVDIDSLDSLTALLTATQVPQPLQQALTSTGVASIADFAYAHTKMEKIFIPLLVARKKCQVLLAPQIYLGH